VTTVTRRRLSWLVPIVVIGVLLYSVFSIFIAATVVYSGYGLPVLVSADGRTLTLGQGTVPCYGTVDPVAEHDATRVALLLRWTTTDPDAPCPAPWAAYPTLTLDVRLDTPLGTRALVDGATGQALPASTRGRSCAPDGCRRATRSTPPRPSCPETGPVRRRPDAFNIFNPPREP
jgi:hypothetical protein